VPCDAHQPLENQKKRLIFAACFLVLPLFVWKVLSLPHEYTRRNFKTKIKVSRKSHVKKNEDELTAFKKNSR